MKKFQFIVLVAVFFNLSVICLDAGLFTGVAVVDSGLVILQPAQSGVGSGRIVSQVRLELGDLIKVGDDGVCYLYFIDGTIVSLDSNSEYRVRREALWKVLDGGEMIVADFNLVLGSKTQQQSLAPHQKKLGDLEPKGECFYKAPGSIVFKPLTSLTNFTSGGIVKTGSSGKVIITYNDSRLLILLEPDTLVYCLHTGINVETGSGLVCVSPQKQLPIFDATMCRVRVRSNTAIFHFQELNDGAHLLVYQGKLQFSLKAQGLPRTVVLRQGDSSILRRSGLIEPSVKFGNPQTFNELNKTIRSLFVEKSFDGLSKIITSIEVDVLKQITSEKNSSLFASEKSVSKLPVAPSGSSASKPGNDQQKLRLDGAASDLEKLFQLPRMDEADRKKARP